MDQFEFTLKRLKRALNRVLSQVQVLLLNKLEDCEVLVLGLACKYLVTSVLSALWLWRCLSFRVFRVTGSIISSSFFKVKLARLLLALRHQLLLEELLAEWLHTGFDIAYVVQGGWIFEPQLQKCHLALVSIC